jgi:hypothetical protein
MSQGQYYSIITDAKAGTIEVLNYSGHRVRFAPDDGKSVGAADGPKADAVTTPAPVPAALPAVRIQAVVAPAVAAPPPVVLPKK